MFNIISDLIVKPDSAIYLKWVAFFISLLLISLICVIARAILNSVLKITLKTLNKKKNYFWAEDSITHKLPEKTANLIIPIVLYNALSNAPYLQQLLDIVVICTIVAVSILLFNAVIAMINDIYDRYDISKTRPIRGVLQVVQIVIYIVIAIIAVSSVMGKNPMVLLGSIGAAAAVVSFIFKDPILGFIAGIQLINNDMLRIGDWITMEQYHADGVVQEISMTTVKVENFDKSLTSIPAQVMVNDAFINWRHMEEAGCRRIKRSIYIDIKSIKSWGKQTQEENNNTNIGSFRKYIFDYLKNRPDIRSEMTTIVRQLDTDGKGLPIEIYGFVNTTDWEAFEDIQSDIFDHLYSVVPEYELLVYQENIAD